jgi:predicted O-linked N-acetylglucosamine transferase (SPINDLY family)
MLVGDRARAFAIFTDAIALAPAAPAPRAALAALHMLERRFASAARECREGLAHTPDQPDLANTCGMALVGMGRAPEGLDFLKRAAAGAPPDRFAIRSNLALAGNYCPGLSASESFEHHLAYARALGAAVPPGPPATRPPDPERPLSIVFLSPDFIGHSVEYFIRPVLENLDRSRFRVVCFSTAPDRPGEEPRRPPCDVWRDVHPLSIGQLEQAIRAEGADVLVELSGHTMGNRLPVLRRRPAPLQLSYLGYPNTTGLAEIDARLVDSLTDPPGESDSLATERLVRLDPCFLCYAASPHAPAVAPRPSTGASTPITFGSFNALSKLNDPLIALWARILNDVPGSRLTLKAAGLAEEEVRADVASRFGAAGLSPDRLDFAPWTESHADHMAQYARVDIALDPFPYNGTTTTAEALRMGVPVVTLAGDRHAGRVGLSLLTAAGFPDLVAATTDGYVRIATSLASDPTRLAALRVGLRDKVARSILCDAAPMAGGFGDALRALWRERCSAGN